MGNENFTPGEQKNNELKAQELAEQIAASELRIEKLNVIIEAGKFGLDIESGKVDVEELIENNTTPEDKAEIIKEAPGKTPIEAIKEEIVAEINSKKILDVNKHPGLKRAGRAAKTVLLAMFVACNFIANTSFTFKKLEASGVTYKNTQVKDLKPWEELKLYQDEINKLDNILVINEAHKNSSEKYIIIDKSSGMAHLYRGENLITTYEVLTGENTGDDQTVTVVEKEKKGQDRIIKQGGKVFWDEGNKQTGAGKYKISRKVKYYDGSPAFAMLNERGIEVPMLFHNAPASRRQFFKDNNTKNNSVSNGCVNWQAEDLTKLLQDKEFGTGNMVYVLPTDNNNKFQMIDGELRFLSDGQNVNRTIRPYEAKPIVLKVANETNREANEVEKEFLDTIAGSKQKLMSMYPTVSNDTYNELAKIAYGILGQESSFGTYGGPRGQYGRFRDYIGTKLDKNVSAGVTQIRITSVNQKIQETFNITKTEDLDDTKKACIATLGLLLDIYTTNIPNDKKDDYRELTIFYYNNPKGSKEAMEMSKEEKIDSQYVKNVLKYSDQVRVYYMVSK